MRTTHLSKGPVSISIFERSAKFARRVAVLANGESRTYEWLEAQSRVRAEQLLRGSADIEEARIGFLMEPGLDYVVTQWAIWRAGGIAVPLCPEHPDPELTYIIEDAGVSLLLASELLDEKLRPIARAQNLSFRTISELGGEVSLEENETVELPTLSLDRRAMILYTSGTTGRPKGAVSTHANMTAHMESLVEAWNWDSQDHILHVLPLHHTHGVVNALCCALYSGATVEFSRPEATQCWDRFASGEVTVFMAVPTIYSKLLHAWEQADDFTRARWTKGAAKLRLMVSGSAALPVSIFERWKAATGHDLLERYGMTEIGMGLSNPYAGERRPGTVGQPLPSVDLRIVNPESHKVLAEGLHAIEEGASGEIQVRGPMVFSEYWGRPDDTAASFEDGWFRTGDEAVLEEGYYRILGRRSVDILKSGGYKISAVEIEEVLRSHPAVQDCAVVGLPCEEWGERVAAAVVVEPGALLLPDRILSGQEGPDARSKAVKPILDGWSRERLAPYKVPRAWLCLDGLPRNAMGKIQKPAVQDLFAAHGEGPFEVSR